MIKRCREWKMSLKVKLSIAVALSFSAAFCCYLLLDAIGLKVIETYLDTPEHTDALVDDLMTDFQDYITENNVSLQNTNLIKDWTDKHKNFEIYYFKGENALAPLFGDINEKTEYTLDASYVEYLKQYHIQFADSKLFCYPLYYSYYYYSSETIIILIGSFAVFLVVFLLLIKRRIDCVKKLAQDLKILEGGDMEYSISLPGNDELSYLAKSIDDMRLSVIERSENENDAIAANRELITAMSHDLRTPLTKQIGYLDIIEYGKYKDESELRYYLNKTKEKAYQIKNISDKLFQYFLAFDTSRGDKELEMICGGEFMNLILFEQSYLLESQGFTVETEAIEEKFDMNINVDDIHRVFDNLFSNIKKYAAQSKPVLLKHKMLDDKIQVSIMNTCREDTRNVESTNIGLKTAQKLLGYSSGSLTTKQEKNTFTVIITLPAIRAL